MIEAEREVMSSASTKTRVNQDPPIAHAQIRAVNQSNFEYGVLNQEGGGAPGAVVEQTLSLTDRRPT